jgi:hypothetical protein
MDINNFSGTKPNLISEKVIKKLNKILDKKGSPIPTNNLGYFYENYIKPHFFTIIVVVIMVVFLLVRHYFKKNKDKEQENDNIELSDIESEIEITEKQQDDTPMTFELENFEQKEEEYNFDTLQRQYEQMMKENTELSEHHIKDIYQKKTDKMIFDEMARIIADGGND